MRTLDRLTVATLPLFLSLGCTTPSIDRDTLPADDVEAPVPSPSLHERAAAQLTDRSREWLESRKCALSCHTTLPFLLGHPLNTPESLELADALVHAVQERVTSWPDVDPFYSGQPQATEAVLNAVALMFYDVRVRGSISEATCRALDALWEAQRIEGGFDWWDFNLAPFERSESDYWAGALVSLALAELQSALHTEDNCEAAQPSHPSLTRLREWLSDTHTSANLHGRIWSAWADRAGDHSLLSAEQRAALQSDLRDRQRDDGGFGIRDFLDMGAATQSDAYASTLAHAVLSGPHEEVDRAALERVEAWLLTMTTLADLEGGLSPNKPEKALNNALFADTTIAYWLWVNQPDQNARP